MLTGKNIVMGITGGIAAWKACLILNKLVIDLHANVDVIMTKGRLLPDCALHCQRHRQDRQRHCRRYADHHRHGH